MKFFRWCARFLLLTMAFVVYAQQPAAAAELVKTVTLPPAPPLLSPALCGKSTFTFLLNGQPVGREMFDIQCSPDGGYRVSAHTDLKVPGASQELISTFELDKAALPLHFTAKGTVGSTAVDQELLFKPDKAEFTNNGATRQIPYTPGAAFLAPNIFYLLQFVAARYDTARGGLQEIVVFPSLKTKMERLARDEVQAGGAMPQLKPLAFDRYNLQVGVISTVLWADAKGRIVVIAVPFQNFVAADENYVSFVPSLRAAMASTGRWVEPDYSAPADAPFTAEEVTVQGKGVKLAGTLLLPKSGKRPFPAVVTITGSGQQTRDEPIPISGLEKYRPFRQIAETLAGKGIAVLRVDDRGVGKSTGSETLMTVTTFDFADDTRAQVAYLRTRPDIDPQRIALVGHSEGGIIAPMVAASDPRIAAIVLMAGTAKNGEAVVMDQSKDLLDQNSTLGKEEKTRQLEEQRRMLRTIAEGGDISKFPDTVKNAWYKAFLTYDPLPAIRKVRQPILIFQGDIDRQVTADQATTLEEAARQAGNKNVTVHVFPGLNHLFLKAKTGAFSEYTSLPSSSIGDEVLEILNDWLREKLHVAN